MKFLPILPQTGWRRTGALNVLLAYTCGIALLICFSISIHSGSSLGVATLIFEGGCGKSSTISVVLHLVINMVASAVLASSNFFMQILSSPSRQELNQSHTWLRSVDIGIPSLKNLRHVSPFKFVGWVVLFISSIPIHLLFNSTIFESTFQGSHWNLTIATQAFTQDTAFFLPGASLSPAGTPSSAYPFNETSQRYINPVGGGGIYGYGDPIVLQSYWDNSSGIQQNIASTAEEAHSWILLPIIDCQKEYKSCSPRTKYGDLIVVVQSMDTNPTGWRRSQVFHFNPADDLSSYWNKHVPSESTNSLWYSTQCTTTRTQGRGSKDSACKNTCLGALGGNGYEFQEANSPQPQIPWQITFNPFPMNTTTQGQALGYNDEFNTLNVQNCLAQPIREQCKVGLSNSLLLVVTFCVFIKAAACNLITWKLQDAPFVNPGDALQSFITSPDTVTEGLGTLDINDAQQLEFGRRQRWAPSDGSELVPILRPRKWTRKTRRIISAIPRAVWIRTYALFFVAMVLLSGALGIAATTSNNDFGNNVFDQADSLISGTGGPNLGYMGALLFANMPQLLLSLCYFSYNAIVTRLSVEQEWNSFSLSYKPLRVTSPTGEQISTYRLQLPYKYSIPLIGISIILHWLLSNSLYLFIIEGDYMQNRSLTGIEDRFRVAEGSLISLGYSPSPLLILFIISGVAISLPLLLGFRKLKGDMVAGGSNSLVLSAACHTLNGTTIQRTSQGTSAIQESQEPDEVQTNSEFRRELAECKLRWGAVALPEGQAQQLFAEDGQNVWHLGFGAKEDEVREAKDGYYYI